MAKDEGVVNAKQTKLLLREVIYISPSGLLMPLLKENREIVMSTSLCGREGSSL